MTRPRLSLSLAVLLALTACTTTSIPDGDRDARTDTADAGPERCDGVDRSCPQDLPAIGAACTGDLDCRYPSLEGCSGSDSAQCIDGRWSYAGFCLPAPMLYEACRAPESGPFPEVALTVTAPTQVVWGLQGGAMIDVVLGFTPAENAPRCAEVRVTLTFDGERVAGTRAVRIPCGRNVRLQEILPGYPCEERAYPYALDLEVVGVGTQHVEGELMGGRPLGGPSPCATVDPDAGV